MVSYRKNVQVTFKENSQLKISPPHHVRPVPSAKLPTALVSAKYVFVREDAVISSLAPRYRGPYMVLDRQDKYFRLQIGS